MASLSRALWARAQERVGQTDRSLVRVLGSPEAGWLGPPVRAWPAVQRDHSPVASQEPALVSQAPARERLAPAP
jgi:hypothetical protein